MDLIKKRLLGAIVILGLTIAIVPSIFDGAHAPATEFAYQNTLNQQSVHTRSTTPVIQTVQHQATAWSVRVGAFSDYHNAQNLEKKLRESGYVAYIQALPDTNLHGVFVGPEQIADNAEIVLAQLQNQLDLQGIIVPYEPTLYVQM